MNDSPGWASPGPASSDPDRPGKEASEPPAAGPEEVAPQDAVPPNWSKKQPPPQAGSWGALPPPPPAPVSGWGGAGGMPPNWGPPPGWGAFPPPPAPQPGVIPLRPLALGEILQGAISTMRIHWRTALSVSFLVALVTQSAATAATGLMVNNSAYQRMQNDPIPTASDLLNVFRTMAGGFGVTVLVAVLGQTFAAAMLSIAVSRSVLGRPMTAREAWREARARLPRVLGLALTLVLVLIGLSAIGTAPGTLLAVFGPPSAGLGLALLGFLAILPVAVWLMVRFSLAAPALVLEKQGVFTSLSRSMRLVRGSWWRVLGIQLLTGVLASIISSIITLPFSILGMILAGHGPVFLTSGLAPTGLPYLAMAGIGAVLGSTLTLPLSAGVTALLYVDQRIRREGLDLELARAAAS